jgi:lipase maturation factor 1
MAFPPAFLQNVRRRLNFFGRGISVEGGPPYQIIESLFLQALGLIFLFAFWSLRNQILPLAGSQGLDPVAPALRAMQSEAGNRAFFSVPTVFWLNASDGCLIGVCLLGMAASVLLFASRWTNRIVQRTAVLICFLGYLSVATVGQPFTLFQWDALLLETAFLSLFAGAPLLVWAYRFLLFRLMFESGCVKLLSGDPNWRNLHALRYHFMTQPLPNPVAYYADHLPNVILDSLTLLTFAIELICPFLLFFPRRLRHLGGAALITLQAVIILTGNYAFFNWLTIALCLWAFDDQSFERARSWLVKKTPMPPSVFYRSFSHAVLAAVMLLGSVQVVSLFAPSVSRPFGRFMNFIAPWQIVNSYGLFAVMTTTRPELIFEGSNDGQSWKEYSFRYKPGDVKRPLPVVAPFQPRVDWQLWFAALDGDYQADRWVGNLIVRLLQGEPQVIALLDKPPFSKPPRYIRTQLYEYWFTTEAERKKTGAIWNRRLERSYLPPISLDMLRSPQR